jgi:lipopolysaccharide biosynthesis protein
VRIGNSAIGYLEAIVRWARRVAQKPYFTFQDRLIRSFAHRPPQEIYIRERIAGEDPLRDAARAAVYVHFDKTGVIHDYVVHQLCELVAAGYRITFMSNAPVFSAHSRARVISFCKEVIWRSNIGYDFGAYKDGIASIADRDRLESLILMNDSVYGPFHSLHHILENIDRAAVDVWGITDSYEYQYHLQSFFLVFFAPAIRSQTFNAFWNDLPYINHKPWVIRNVEVKLTEVLKRASLRTGVLAAYPEVVAKTRKALLDPNRTASKDRGAAGFARYYKKVMADYPVNPVHYFWNTLIEDFHCPFIKRELLKSNPAMIPSVPRWREVIAAQSCYDLARIERHLNEPDDNLG